MEREDYSKIQLHFQSGKNDIVRAKFVIVLTSESSSLSDKANNLRSACRFLSRVHISRKMLPTSGVALLKLNSFSISEFQFLFGKIIR